MRVLVVNAGSSSLKLRVVDDDGDVGERADLGPVDDSTAAELEDFVARAGGVDAVGHRVVHGGDRFRAAVLVTPAVRDQLEELAELAPLHNPPAIRAIDECIRLLPTTENIACFDTAFHSTLEPAAYTVALPAEWRQRWSLRRYGFHGLSCQWSLSRATEMLGRQPERLVVCHLGAGASVTAIRSGSSVDTSMGYTPLPGLVMATRPGDIDPGILLRILGAGATLADVEDVLYHRSGLAALDPTAAGDMRRLLERRGGDPAAGLAVEVYVRRLASVVAAMAAAAGGMDALVFTGGVGEHAGPVRAETCARLGWAGVELDEAANEQERPDTVISAPGSSVACLVIESREDLVIAADCRQMPRLE